MTDQSNGAWPVRGEAPTAVALQFAMLAQHLLDARTVHDVLLRIISAGEAVVPCADLVSIALHTPTGHLDTPTASSPLAEKLDQLQNELGEGPAIDANHTPGLGMAHSEALETDKRYPGFGPAATQLGIRSALSVGLFPTQEPPRMGVLTFYSTRGNTLDDADRDIAVVLAAHASTALAGTMATTAAELKVAQLHEALRSRDVIGQAKGVLMERRGVNEDEAFTILREASQSLNIKLVNVATTLAERRSQI